MNGLIDRIPNFSGKYIEPFAGSACLFWRLEPQKAVLGDLNPDLISCYLRVAASPDAVHKAYSNCENSPGEYYRIREAFRSEQDPDVRAGYFIYLNRFCFNGLYRTDKSGRFNVPYGGRRTGMAPTLSQLHTYASKLQNVSLICCDFEEVVDNSVSPGDFVYLDPPYFSSTSRVFNGYTGSRFSSADLARFGKLLERVDSAGATFIATYLEGTEIAEIAQRWQSHDVTVLRRMSGFTSGRKRTREVVLTNAIDGRAV